MHSKSDRVGVHLSLLFIVDQEKEVQQSKQKSEILVDTPLLPIEGRLTQERVGFRKKKYKAPQLHSRIGITIKPYSNISKKKQFIA